MANKVLTVVLNAVEGVAKDINPVMAAVINAAHEAGHIVKEIRLMTDGGEQKVATNTVPGVTVPPPEPPVAPPPTVVTAPPPLDTPAAESVTEPTPADQVPPQTNDEKRLALLAQLDELDKEEEADIAAADPTGTGNPGTPAS